MTARNTRPIKVMYVTFSLDHGGAEKMMYDVATGLNRNCFDAHVLCLQPGGTLRGRFEESGIPVHTIIKKPMKDVTLPARIFKLFAQERPDVVHVQNGYSWLYSTLAARASGAGVVYVEHSVWETPSSLYLMLSKIMEVISTRIVTPSEYVKNLISTKQKVRNERVDVIYNGVDIDRIRNRKDIHLKKREVGIEDGDRVIGIVARLTPVKNHVSLIKAMKIVCERIERCKLLVVGDGELRPQLEQEVRQSGLEKAIAFLGTRNDVYDLLHTMDVFVMSSISEGFPISVLEAMAAGVPVLAPAVGGIPEALDHGKAGRMYSSHEPHVIAEGLLGLLSDRAAAECYAKEASAFVQANFSIEGMVDRYTRLYAETAGRDLF